MVTGGNKGSCGDSADESDSSDTGRQVSRGRQICRNRSFGPESCSDADFASIVTPPIDTRKMSGLSSFVRSRVMSEPTMIHHILDCSARYFVMKSNNHRNLDISNQKAIWATNSKNEGMLNEAFSEGKEVYLVFSVQGSGHFQGYARMKSPIGSDRCKDFTGAGLGCTFAVEWVKRGNLPFQQCHHLLNPWNDNQKVQVSRDGQEIEPSVGEKLLCLWERVPPYMPMVSRRHKGHHHLGQFNNGNDYGFVGGKVPGQMWGGGGPKSVFGQDMMVNTHYGAQQISLASDLSSLLSPEALFTAALSTPQVSLHAGRMSPLLVNHLSTHSHVVASKPSYAGLSTSSSMSVHSPLMVMPRTAHSTQSHVQERGSYHHHHRTNNHLHPPRN